MYEKLIALLTAKFTQARKDGLQQLARSLALQVADENEAQALVDKLNVEKVTDFIKEWRKEVDSEITKSTKSYEENLKSKYDFVEKEKKPNPSAGKTDSDDMATLIANAIKNAVEPLQKEIQSFKLGKTAETRKQTLENVLKEAPESFKKTMLKSFEKMNFESDEDFNTFVSETQNDLKDIVQDNANNGMNLFPRPAGSSGSSSKQVEDDIKSWAEKSAPAKK